jgi:hypothetical protein
MQRGRGSLRSARYSRRVGHLIKGQTNEPWQLPKAAGGLGDGGGNEEAERIGVSWCELTTNTRCQVKPDLKPNTLIMPTNERRMPLTECHSGQTNEPMSLWVATILLWVVTLSFLASLVKPCLFLSIREQIAILLILGCERLCPKRISLVSGVKKFLS